MTLTIAGLAPLIYVVLVVAVAMLAVIHRVDSVRKRALTVLRLLVPRRRS
ncbi:hypothetical protein [Streptomyces lydicus]